MGSHDPLQFAAEFAAKLATRSRHVCVFLGAGASKACGLPDVVALQERILTALSPVDKVALEKQLEGGRSLEQVLSRLRRIAALLDDDQKIDNLSAKDATELDTSICQIIVKELNTADADDLPMRGLGAWVARADYQKPIELFTVNYDLLVEMALEYLRVPYFDGFVGNLRARFHTDLVEGASMAGADPVPRYFARLWKLHGSVNWAWESDQEIVRLGQPVTDRLAAAIYPSDSKYEESRRVPFVVLQDRLRRALQQPESLVLISGYSFGDSHLNELIFDAAARHQRSEFIAFCFAEIPKSLAARSVSTPNLQAVTGTEAILGGRRAKWKAPADPPPDLWVEGKFGLCDFRHLGAYLARSSTRESEHDPLIAQLLERIATSDHSVPETHSADG